MKQYLYFNGNKVATPTKCTPGNEKIWSNNAGRAANCEFVGDIRAIKKTLHIEWANLNPADVTLINSYISNVNAPFFSVTYLDEEFKEDTRTFYAATPSYEQFGWDSHRQFCKVLSVDLVEK